MIVIIDNYDSFTHNLERYFIELGATTRVVKNDEMSIEQLASLEFSHLVLSPGPCTPNESGLCLEAIKRFAGIKPILGVCLGHQAIAQVYGAKIERAANVRHGKTSTLQVIDNGTVLFKECASTFIVTRYHSLIVNEKSLCRDFLISAICVTNGVREVMAIENPTLGLYGLQFHPESLLTEFGHKVLENFLMQGY